MLSKGIVVYMPKITFDPLVYIMPKVHEEIRNLSFPESLTKNVETWLTRDTLLVVRNMKLNGWSLIYHIENVWHPCGSINKKESWAKISSYQNHALT
jgi:hypothetical protein